MLHKWFVVPLLVFAFVFSSSGIVFSDDKPKTPEQLVKEAKENIKEVSIQDVKKMMDNNEKLTFVDKMMNSKEKVIFLDVRDKEEFDKGHLPGTINMSRGLLDFHVHEIIKDKDAKIVVI